MPSLTDVKRKFESKASSKAQAAIEFAHQAERLAQYCPSSEDDITGSTQAVEAKFITGQDPIIETANGGRLPAVPIEEAIKLNRLKDLLEVRDPSQNEPVRSGTREARDGSMHRAHPSDGDPQQSTEPEAPLRQAVPPPRTNPLFPPLPLYGPPTFPRNLHCWTFRLSSAVLSFCFLLVIILGAAFKSIPLAWTHIWLRLTFRNPDKRRPFFQEEENRKRARKDAARAWKKKMQRQRGGNNSNKVDADNEGEEGKEADEFVPLDGGPDPIICDVGYYARRVGLDCEVFDVQTEDGFIIELWHLYNPRGYQPANPDKRAAHSPEIFPINSAANGAANGVSGPQYPPGEKRYPVLLIHGLLQSAGAYCTNDDDSLAFFLTKSGYDVWLGNNRCGFKPRHSLLKYGDPRMWAWNIHQMGVMDLPALISRVLSETGFEKLALVAHSQGTTQTLVALAKEQRPDIGSRISVFCALAPAAYAGPLIGKMYFKFMRVISPGLFRAIFGIHAFIPFMMLMHSMLPGNVYGAMGYRVFSFLFDWTDEKWERVLRDRMFQFAPVYVSAESMRWWLGRECFARQKCILATHEEKHIEDREDEEEDQRQTQSSGSSSKESEDEPSREIEDESSRPPQKPQNSASNTSPNAPLGNAQDKGSTHPRRNTDRARYAWYGPQTPPFALWVCGADRLVDGRRLLRRFDRNREPYVDVVHAKIIEGYEHLDVIWAMDSIEKVGKEVREVVWRTASEGARNICRTPKGCEYMTDFYQRLERRENARTEIDASAGEWSEKGRKQVGRGGGEAIKVRGAKVGPA
ncbi:alpha/beta-hydrolase [Lepidopterella palustris CBS 459.81]|uniref:Alpha/beta-hydrolase n=1 Tax=Lepidopterella palustris CBS 459.81 TaxID=1314670 RepID=A0A8E2EH02_9PEZI|nr:alpha/beta-hydrolase [Lepidopterella palustris CBS 459.81]